MTIGSAAGYCTIHKMDKMFVGLEDATEPTCVKCVADATPKMGRTQIVEDPGEEFFNGKGTTAQISVFESKAGLKEAERVPKAPTLDTRYNYTVADVVGIAVAQLRHLPMPEDIKEFKRVQKVIKTLQSLVENSNG